MRGVNKDPSTSNYGSLLEPVSYRLEWKIIWKSSTFSPLNRLIIIKLVTSMWCFDTWGDRLGQLSTLAATVLLRLKKEVASGMKYCSLRFGEKWVISENCDTIFEHIVFIFQPNKKASINPPNKDSDTSTANKCFMPSRK